MKIFHTTFQLILALVFLHNAHSQEAWLNVESGTEFSLAMKSDSTIWSWGNNTNGQLGIGNTINQLIPVQIGTDTIWKRVSAGAFHALAVKEDGTLWAWGLNSVGQLGTGDLIQKTAPTQVGVESDWKEAWAGQGHSIGIKKDSTMWAWGYNSNGQLGIGSTTNQNSPVQIGNLHEWDVASCGGAHTLALKVDSTLWAFGFNGTGQLGDGTTIQSIIPIQIGSAFGWTSISAGFEFSLAAGELGSLWSWGFNGNGQLGIGNTLSSSVPVLVQINSLVALAQIDAGSSFAFSTNINGELFGWGYNGNGQLGTGNTMQQNNPVQIGTETNWQDISGASGAVSGGTVYGTHSVGLQWPYYSICTTGANYIGQLGDNTTDQSVFFNCLIGELNVGLVENVNYDDFIVAPNPSNGLLTVNVGKLGANIYNCKVLNSIGKEIYENSFNTEIFNIDLQSISKGIYIIVLENEFISLKKQVIIE
jgi:hypothetical protein